jgi:hypothetical protein
MQQAMEQTVMRTKLATAPIGGKDSVEAMTKPENLATTELSHVLSGRMIPRNTASTSAYTKHV